MNRNRTGRRGAIVPLSAILIIPLCAMLAFSIDLGYSTSVQAELQSAADSGALAGAEKLQDLFVNFYLPGQTNQAAVYSTATTDTGVDESPIYTAKKFAKLNRAGGVYINVPDADVEAGYTDTAGNYTKSPATYDGTHFPNTIKITTRRSGDANGTTNGSLPLFFANTVGWSKIDLEAKAAATIYAGDISDFKAINNLSASILPVALDMDIWKNFYNTGKSPDNTTHIGGPKTADNLRVYPGTENKLGGGPGAFGLLNVGDPSGANAFKNWILNGETPNDITYLQNNGVVGQTMLPLSLSTDGGKPGPKWWNNQTGLEGQTDNFAQEIGKPNLLPLFKAKSPYVIDGSGNYDDTNYQASWDPTRERYPTGTNGYYDIVGFVSVQVTIATGQGNSTTVSIQPIASIDLTSVIATPKPAGESMSQFNTYHTTFTSAKLTQ